jgi:hypothetical protein
VTVDGIVIDDGGGGVSRRPAVASEDRHRGEGETAGGPAAERLSIELRSWNRWGPQTAHVRVQAPIPRLKILAAVAVL